jgi:hypothetical protein
MNNKTRTEGPWRWVQNTRHQWTVLGGETGNSTVFACRLGMIKKADADLVEAAPDLLRAAEGILSEVSMYSDSYCGWCKSHAPKDDDGNIIGDLAHRIDCPAISLKMAIVKAGGSI